MDIIKEVIELTTDCGLELWATKTLSLAWLHRPQGHRHNPCLIWPGSEAVYRHNSLMLKTNQHPTRPSWHWRVEPTLGAWLSRLLGRANREGRTIPPSVPQAMAAIKEYLLLAYPGCWPDVEAIAADAERDITPTIPETCFHLVRIGGLPLWEGYEQDVAKLGEPEVPAPPPQPAAHRKPAKAAKTTAAGLF